MADPNAARKRAEMPEGSGSILSTRSLATAHRRLDQLVRPGMAVLDVGCGNGAITRDIVDKVGLGGRVVGADISTHLLEQARRRYGNVPHLVFERRDVYALGFAAEFDIVTTARVLQWLADPAVALRSMVAAAVPGGRVVVLDYNHHKLRWHPAPPRSVEHFYRAFIDWRADAGMDNAIADHLAAMFAHTGLQQVVVTPQHEVAQRGDPDFAQRIGIWEAVMASRGKQMVADGAITEGDRSVAEREYQAWAREYAEEQELYLLAAEGVVS